MKKIVEYVPIITVCLIYFGFCNLHYYYKEFNIDIYHYISNTEILLSFLPTIVLLASTLYIFVYNRLINHPDFIKTNNDKEIIEDDSIEEREGIKPQQKKKIWRILSTFPVPLLLLLLIESVSTIILTKYFCLKTYELQDVNLIYACLFLSVIYFSSTLFKNQNLINDNILLITIFSVIYIGNQISTYRKLDADKIKDGISNRKIIFEYSGKKISTSNQNVYIGQTQSHLFLYNIKNKSTYVYKTENIDSLIIK
ncbi:hypothetical protein [Flavobacterium nitrogenifigens]|uniref:Uncharacterized protein n=1 Tax=Flavobacterium nitrogenifigens TaxID=1617283 RepID=A0A521B031_9FLAO|nr:hypothetical protein [Flavobacterium nitrogenifigens]KAF2329130.1 hypothetical protein DM397_15750 [Flavobacterium nitrogenifigens]SMO40395.1 hypothetical protein SAMN06265220_101562 [Flavobacterium nitrogenifigens]